VSIDDVRGAVVYGAHPLVDTMAVDGERVTVEMRSAETRARYGQREVVHGVDEKSPPAPLARLG
jgi:hypothetical protein